MHALVKCGKKFTLPVTLVIILLHTLVPVSASERLDLFDAAGNHLMFVLFENDANSKSSSRTIYMSDSTFVRKVVTVRDAQGKKTRETSLNFNEDTLFSTTFGTSGDSKTMTIKDQFGTDELGGPVSYRASGAADFIFSQQGTAINKISYEYTPQGTPATISVADNAGKLLYYGKFSEVSIAASKHPVGKSLTQISIRGNNVLKVQFFLTQPAVVKCELIALDGRHAGALFNSAFPGGTHHKNIRISASALSARTTEGIYLVVVSVDGKVRASDKLLLMRSGRGSL